MSAWVTKARPVRYASYPGDRSSASRSWGLGLFGLSFEAPRGLAWAEAAEPAAGSSFASCAGLAALVLLAPGLRYLGGQASRSIASSGTC